MALTTLSGSLISLISTSSRIRYLFISWLPTSLSKDGLPVYMDVAVLYRVDGKKAPELLREYGPDYEEKHIKQIVRTSVRDAIAEMESSVVYQERTKLQERGEFMMCG